MAVSEHRKQVKNVQKRIYRAQDIGYVFSDEFKQSINGLSTEVLLTYDSDFVRSQAINFHQKGQLVKPGKANPVRANMPEPKKTSAKATKVEAKKATNATNKSAQPKQTATQSATKAKQTAKPNLDTEQPKPKNYAQTEKKKRELHRIRNQIYEAEKRGYEFPQSLKDSLSSWNTNRLKRFTKEKVYKTAKFKFADEVVTGTKGSQIERSRRSKKGADTRYGKPKADYNAWVMLTFFKDKIKNGIHAFLDKLPRKIDTHKKWWEFWLVDPVAEELRRKGFRGHELKKERERILKEITEEVDRDRWEKQWKQDQAEYEEFLHRKIKTDELWDEQDRIDRELGRENSDVYMNNEGDLGLSEEPELPALDTGGLPTLNEGDIMYYAILNMIDEYGTPVAEYLRTMLKNEIERYGLPAVLQAFANMGQDEVADLQQSLKYKQTGMSGSDVNRTFKRLGEAIKGSAFTLWEAKQIGTAQDKMDDGGIFYSTALAVK